MAVCSVSKKTRERVLSSRRVNDDARRAFKDLSAAFQTHAAHAPPFNQETSALRLLKNFSARLTRAHEQIIIHLSTAQPQRHPSSAEPLARHIHLASVARIKDCLIQSRSARREHSFFNAEARKVLQTFRRDELAAQFRARKFFLLGNHHARAHARQMNRRARSRRPAAHDHNIIFSRRHAHLKFYSSKPFFKPQRSPHLFLAASPRSPTPRVPSFDALKTRRKANRRSTLIRLRPARWANPKSSLGWKLRRIESAPSSRIRRL